MKTCVALILLLIAGVSVGDIQKRVIGGRDCTDEEKKTFVFIKFDTDKGPYICSGSVIGDGTWVLTAKHCQGNGPFTITNVKRQIQTATYSYEHTTVDLMLIKLNTKWTSFPLASTTDCQTFMTTISDPKRVPFNLVAVGRDTTCTTEKPMCADVQVFECAGLNTKKNGAWVNRGVNCLSGSSGLKLCGGDSGGPLISKAAQYGVYVGNSTTDDDLFESICENAVRTWITTKTGIKLN